MGRHIITDGDLHRVTLEDGEWVDILEKVPRSLRVKAQKAAMQYKGKLQAGKTESMPVEVEFDVTALSTVLLEGMVKAWSFKYDDGKAIPVTPETVGQLDEATADFILAEIDKLNPARTGEEKKD